MFRVGTPRSVLMSLSAADLVAAEARSPGLHAPDNRPHWAEAAKHGRR